jgi:hypothetical protein
MPFATTTTTAAETTTAETTTTTTTVNKVNSYVKSRGEIRCHIQTTAKEDRGDFCFLNCVMLKLWKK